MNLVLLFYGSPCSGKDTLIKFLLKRRKHIFFFLYIKYKLTEDSPSCKHTEEKIFFIKLIKYYYKVKNECGKLFYRGGKQGVKISFSFLMHLVRHLYIYPRKCVTTQSVHTIWNLLEKLQKNDSNMEKTVKTRNNHDGIKIKIMKKTPIRVNNNFEMFNIFYKQVAKWSRYFESFLRTHKMCIYSISMDAIEKQLGYLYHTFTTQKCSIYKRAQRGERYFYSFSRKYIVYEKEKKKMYMNVYFPVVRRLNIKDGKLILKFDKKKGKKKKNISEIQLKCWKIARKIAYTYCLRLMHKLKKRKQNHSSEKTKNVIIILNDTFHLPSMRKQFYVLSKRYHFRYVQTYLNCPLKICLLRNKKRKKFKLIPEETIIRNYAYHKKYGIWVNQGEKKKKSEIVNIVKGGKKWQAKVLSLQYNSFYKQKLADVLLFLHKQSRQFTNPWGERNTRIREKRKEKTQINRLDVLNVMINHIVHKKLKEIPNDKKNVYAKKFHRTKLQILKECRNEKIYTLEDIEGMFSLE
ncbi:L-seryl-tRNA(Sec) kinase, putative [Plasmodium ovale]|uniref:L-seryl-tRNA(Sec) kinase, putative n=1 Tax=Plasmodium ovale TaxID=36330 RepID=A0A1D3KX04_PLAOA|nr:L-seryl-tRNA(Sec) kinase, putative [Plasmodium ovale]